MKKYLHTPDRGSITGQSKNTTKSNVLNHCSLKFLKRAEIFRQHYHRSLPHHGWRLETWNALNNPQTAQQIGGCSFQVVRLVEVFLVWVSSRSLAFPQISQQPLWLVNAWGGRSLANPVSFRNFLHVLNCLLPELKTFPCKLDCFTSTCNILTKKLHE